MRAPASLGFLAVGVGEDVVVASAADTGAHEYRAIGEFVGLGLIGATGDGGHVGVAEDGPFLTEVIGVEHEVDVCAVDILHQYGAVDAVVVAYLDVFAL